MKLREALLNARSYLAIIIGFLIAFAIVVWVERQMPTRIESSEGMVLSDSFPALPPARALTFQEAIWARVAWQYFVNNTQPSGLINAVDGQPWTSLWHQGSYILSLIAAKSLDVISSDEFDERVTSSLNALADLPLTAQRLPGTYYHSINSNILYAPNIHQETDAIALSRLLNALQILLWRAPQHANDIYRLLASWQLQVLFESRTHSGTMIPITRWVLDLANPRNTFGYRLYASVGLRLLDVNSSMAVTQPPEGQKMLDIDGIMIPDEGLRTPWGQSLSLISVPYLLVGLENGLDNRTGEMSWRIMQIQQRRRDRIPRRAPIGSDYAESAITFSNSAPLARSTVGISQRQQLPERQVVTTTRTAFAWHALFENDWSTELRQQVEMLRVPGRGWQFGFNENNSVNDVIEADTNAIVLESLAYTVHGPLLCLSCLNTSPLMANQHVGVSP